MQLLSFKSVIEVLSFLFWVLIKLHKIWFIVFVLIKFIYTPTLVFTHVQYFSKIVVKFCDWIFLTSYSCWVTLIMCSCFLEEESVCSLFLFERAALISHKHWWSSRYLKTYKLLLLILLPYRQEVSHSDSVFSVTAFRFYLIGYFLVHLCLS